MAEQQKKVTQFQRADNCISFRVAEKHTRKITRYQNAQENLRTHTNIVCKERLREENPSHGKNVCFFK